MLTPQDVSGKEFVKAVFGGYDMSAVDDFLETLTEDYTALYKENAILKSKIKVLVEKVEEYRSTEDAMRMALLTAQKMGDDLISEAKTKSEAMLTDTETAVNRRLSELSQEVADEEARLQAVKESTTQVVEASQEIIKQHMVFLSKLNEITSPDPEPEPESVPDKDDEIDDTAKQIDLNVTNLLSDEPSSGEEAAAPAASVQSDSGESEPTKLFTKIKDGPEDPDDDEPTSPRPKFDFENLQFGSNYPDSK